MFAFSVAVEEKAVVGAVQELKHSLGRRMRGGTRG